MKRITAMYRKYDKYAINYTKYLLQNTAFKFRFKSNNASSYMS